MLGIMDNYQNHYCIRYLDDKVEVNDIRENGEETHDELNSES